MAEYKFLFPAAASGFDVVVRNRGGTLLASDTLDVSSGVIEYSFTHAYGGYFQATATDGDETYWSIAEGAPVPEAGSGTATSETDGVGAVFFGGVGLQAAYDNVPAYCEFVTTDDPPRAPQRDDLMVLDPEDETIINIVRTGLYDVSLNTPIRARVTGMSEGTTFFAVIGKLQVEVNGGTQPPVYDYNNRAYWIVDEVKQYASVSLNWTFPQVLLAGDTLRLSLTAELSGLGTLDGYLELNPDITMVITYRGSVTLPA